MTKRTKRLLLWSTILLFCILSPIIIFYAQGYKYSFRDGTFYLTGAISLKANVDARVYVDDELEGDTSFFGSSFNVGSLLPGTYKVSLQRDGYSSWRKDVTVREGLVTDFSHILLLPLEGEDGDRVIAEVEELFIPAATPSPTASPTQTPRPRVSISPTPVVYSEPVILEKGVLYSQENQILTEIASNVLGFEVSENGKKIAYWTSYEVWVVWREGQQYAGQPDKERELVTRFSSPITGLAWFRGDNHLAVRFGKTEFRYRITEIDTRGGINIIEL